MRPLTVRGGAPLSHAPRPSRRQRHLAHHGACPSSEAPLSHTAPITAPDDAAPDEPCLTTPRLTNRA